MKAIVQFVWPEDDEGDYLSHLELTKAQIEEVRTVLTQAEADGRIRSGWYVGRLSLSRQRFLPFMKTLDIALYPEKYDPLPGDKEIA